MTEKLSAEDLRKELEVLKDEVRDASPSELAIAREIAMDAFSNAGVRSPGKLIDAAIGEVRPSGKENEQGTALTFEDVEPWGEEVDSSQLLDAISGKLERFVVLSKEAAVAITLWVLLTFTFQKFKVLPRLGIQSPIKRCGKTTLLEFLTLVTDRPLPSSNISPAAIFRCIEQYHPTLLIDEADTFLRTRQGDTNEELRGLINSGHTRATAFVIRVQGDKHEVRNFSTFAPMAVAMIGELPDTVADRSIPVELKRKTKAEEVDRLGDEEAAELAELKRKIVRWVKDKADQLGTTAEAPDSLDDRAADNWRPLLSIADAAGGNWLERAREAAIALSRGRDEVEQSRGIQALADLRDLFKSEEQLRSSKVVEKFASMEERDGSTYGRARKPITPRQLAVLLKPFGVKPAAYRDGTTGGVRGYDRTECQSVFDRYLAPPDSQEESSSSEAPNNPPDADTPREPPHPPVLSATSATPGNGTDLGEVASATPSDPVADTSATDQRAVADRAAPKPLQENVVADVADRTPENGGSRIAPLLRWPDQAAVDSQLATCRACGRPTSPQFMGAEGLCRTCLAAWDAGGKAAP